MDKPTQPKLNYIFIDEAFLRAAALTRNELALVVLIASDTRKGLARPLSAYALLLGLKQQRRGSGYVKVLINKINAKMKSYTPKLIDWRKVKVDGLSSKIIAEEEMAQFPNEKPWEFKARLSDVIEWTAYFTTMRLHDKTRNGLSYVAVPSSFFPFGEKPIKEHGISSQEALALKYISARKNEFHTSAKHMADWVGSSPKLIRKALRHLAKFQQIVLSVTKRFYNLSYRTSYLVSILAGGINKLLTPLEVAVSGEKKTSANTADASQVVVIEGVTVDHDPWTAIFRDLGGEL